MLMFRIDVNMKRLGIRCKNHSFLWFRVDSFFWETLGLIYEMNVRPKFGRTVVSTQNLEFINMDVSGGYDQISRQVWVRVRKFLS